MQPEAAELDANTFCGGLVYAFRPGLDLTFALMKNIYSSEAYNNNVLGNIELSKDLFNLGFGLQYKFR
jgi:hypothetical protein